MKKISRNFDVGINISLSMANTAGQTESLGQKYGKTVK